MLNIFSLARRAHRRVFYGLMAATIALGLCLTSAVRTAAIPLDLIFQGIRIIQLANLSEQQEVQIGAQINQQLVQSEFRMYRDPSAEAYVSQIGQNLARAGERPNLPFRFQIVADRAVNAFATMGGYVYVTTGLMLAADNEAQLAGVIGHEIGHINGRHLVEQMKNDAIYRGIATAAGLDRQMAVAIGVDLALRKPRSRADEFDADERGLRYLGRVGYAQSALPDFLQKLRSQRSTPAFLSTHPAPAERISNLNNKISQPGGAGLDNVAYRNQLSQFR